jgi:hypothetical protein
MIELVVRLGIGMIGIIGCSAGVAILACRVVTKLQGYKHAYAFGQLQGEAGYKFAVAVRTSQLRVGFMRYAFMRGWRKGNLQYSRKLAKFCSAYGGRILVK